MLQRKKRWRAGMKKTDEADTTDYFDHDFRDNDSVQKPTRGVWIALSFYNNSSFSLSPSFIHLITERAAKTIQKTATKPKQRKGNIFECLDFLSLFGNPNILNGLDSYLKGVKFRVTVECYVLHMLMIVMHSKKLENLWKMACWKTSTEVGN